MVPGNSQPRSYLPARKAAVREALSSSTRISVHDRANSVFTNPEIRTNGNYAPPFATRAPSLDGLPLRPQSTVGSLPGMRGGRGGSYSVGRNKCGVLSVVPKA